MKTIAKKDTWYSLLKKKYVCYFHNNFGIFIFRIKFFALIVFNYSGQVTVTYNAHKQTTKHINTPIQFLINCYSN